MSEIKATPRSNRSLGALADALRKVDEFARKPFGYDNPPVAMISDLLGIPATQRTLDRLSYGEPLTTGRGQATRMRPDTEEALMAAPQFIPGLRQLAMVTKDLPVGAVIKDPGGNWLSGSVEGALKGLKPRIRTEGINGHTAEHVGADTAINNWIDKQLTRYVKKDMATSGDPVRALAERGVLHVDPAELNFRPEMHGKYLGPGQTAVALSPSAKAWEGAADLKVSPMTSGQILGGDEWVSDIASRAVEINPWLAKVPADTRVFGIEEPRNLPQDLGFSHLIDELRNATNPNSGLPRELLLKYESLPQVSVPQAVERVAKINAWRAAQKAEADLARANNAATVLHKDYPDKGFKWVELKSPDESMFWEEGLSPALNKIGSREQAKNALQDALKYEGDTMGHCVGGYCDNVAEGRTRIFSLRDSKGQPHTTIEVRPDQSNPYNRWVDSLKHGDPSDVELYRKAVVDRAGNDFKKWADQNNITVPESFDSIVQIKGKQNRAPNPEYLPYVQDFVRSGKWSDVGDLQNSGLLSSKQMFHPDDLNKYRERGEQVGDYLTEGEYQRLLDMQKAGFAAGGLVNQDSSGYNPALADSMVNSLNAELFPQ